MKYKNTLPAFAARADGLVLPEKLAQQAADAVRELLAESAAANTTRSYAAALRYWAGWHQARFCIELTLPVSEAVVIQFLVDHIQRKNKTGLVSELPPTVDLALVDAGLKARLGPLKLSTVTQRVAVLSTAHKLKRLANPCELACVRTLLSRARRSSVKRGERPTKKTAITRPELEAMLATCDESLEGLRDRALLCFGFASGGRRRSEIAAADMRDLRKTGDESYIYRLEYSKTQQAGVTVDSTPDKPILGRSAQALSAWLEAAGIHEGAIFRRIWKDRVGPPLLAIIENFQISVSADGKREHIIEAFPLGILRDGKFERGGDSLAIPPKAVQPATIADIKKIYDDSVPEAERFRFATLASNKNVPVPVNGNKFFNKHIAVVGSTGSGKSHNPNRRTEVSATLFASQAVLRYIELRSAGLPPDVFRSEREGLARHFEFKTGSTLYFAENYVESEKMARMKKWGGKIFIALAGVATKHLGLP